MKKFMLLLICAAVFINTAPEVEMNDTTLYKLKNFELNKIEDTANNPVTFSGIQRVTLDGFGEDFNELCNRVSSETANLPSSIIKAFNEYGFELVVTDDISKYTKQKTQEIAPGYYISGMTHISKFRNQIIILPTTESYTSLYHEFGHATQYIYDMDYKTLFNAFKFDSDGAEELTGKYSNSTPSECWAEAFEYIILNQNNPDKMDDAAEKMPVSFQLYNKIINEGENK